MVSATALPALGESETLVRNMQSHTTSSTADRYNGVAPSNNQRPPFTNYTTAPVCLDLTLTSLCLIMTHISLRLFSWFPLY